MLQDATTTVNEKAAYSIDELVEITPLSSAYIRKLIKGGDLKARKAGRRVLILRSDLDDYLQGLKSVDANSNS
jgi:excisionase family DNA binding protein